ncbi:hypothetical protein [Fictibacillus phosphorivorans]|uniref:hypothetical protein n=1 Tax=Fictibacillus phosphorivorans TaxID=1221500 RepID=UPI0012937563|nr:hypothetical protein [Fictibacillus phosphorivorans]MQR97596.1 hypothetical protein [Fictibacillus phosphorivorans]
MRFKDLVNETGYHISFERIFELRTKEVSLRIIVNKSVEPTELLINPHPDSKVKTLQVDFPNYITYSVIFDDYTISNDTDKFQGEAFRIYTKSNYFDFIRKVSDLNTLLPGENITHYSLACIEHKVDIISNKEPNITEIN